MPSINVYQMHNSSGSSSYTVVETCLQGLFTDNVTSSTTKLTMLLCTKSAKKFLPGCALALRYSICPAWSVHNVWPQLIFSHARGTPALFAHSGVILPDCHPVKPSLATSQVCNTQLAVDENAATDSTGVWRVRCSSIHFSASSVEQCCAASHICWIDSIVKDPLYEAQ